MIGYVTLGSNNLDDAERFYNTLLGIMGIAQVNRTDRMIVWSNGQGPALSIVKPYNEQPASHGNGTMIALTASTPELVDQVYAKAIELGGTDEGEPGPRGGRMYSAYFRDLDGNKLLVFAPLR